MPSCSVPFCKNRSKPGFRLFRIPTGENNIERRKMWLKFINRDQLPSTARICETHFEESQFESHRADNRKLLKWNAVPSIHVREYKSLPVKKNATNQCSISSDLVNQVSRTTISCFSDNKNKESSVKNQCSISSDVVNQVSRTTKICDDKESSVTEEENDSFVINAQYLQLKNNLKNAYIKINTLEKRIKDMEEKYSRIFNKDQIILMTTGTHKGVEWSDESINNGLKLYMACGFKGYEEILKQNLPYPSIETLQHYIQHIKCEPGILDEIFDLLDINKSENI